MPGGIGRTAPALRVDDVHPCDAETYRVARGRRRGQRARQRTERDQEDVADLRTLLLEALETPPPRGIAPRREIRTGRRRISWRLVEGDQRGARPVPHRRGQHVAARAARRGGRRAGRPGAAGTASPGPGRSPGRPGSARAAARRKWVVPRPSLGSVYRSDSADALSLSRVCGYGHAVPPGRSAATIQPKMTLGALYRCLLDRLDTHARDARRHPLRGADLGRRRARRGGHASRRRSSSGRSMRT